MKSLWTVCAVSVCLGVGMAALWSAEGRVPSEPLTATEDPAGSAVLPMPTVQLEFSSRGLVVSGTAPTEAERQGIAQHLRRLYGDMPLVDRLEVAAVANPNWLSGAFLPDLRSTGHGTAMLAQGALVIDGAVDGPQAAHRVQASAQAAQDAGLRVVIRLQVVSAGPAAP